MKNLHRWTFSARFRRHAFGWRSQPAITRIREAVTEIKKAARTDAILAADGAVLLIEKLSPALERVDSSSGSIGTAVNHAIEKLVPIIGRAPAPGETRDKWLNRLWTAIQDDDIPYIENLGDFWGDLCATPGCASSWADKLIATARLAWSPDPGPTRLFQGHFRLPQRTAQGRTQRGNPGTAPPLTPSVLGGWKIGSTSPGCAEKAGRGAPDG